MAELLVAAAVSRVGSAPPDDFLEEDPFEQQQQTKAIKLKRAPNKPTDVYSWFEITLQNIDVPSQTFTASIEVHLFWQDYNLPNLVPNYTDTDFVIHDDYVPLKMSEIFENKKDIGNTDPQFTYFDKTGTVYMMFVVQCTFVERMELQRFPFDRQFMNMSFNAHIKPVMEEEGPWNWILEYPTWMPPELNDQFNQKFAVRMLSSITEYELLEPWVDFDKEEAPLSIRLRVNRLPSYYFGNIVFPNFLIVAGCFSAFVVPREDIADRLSVTVTLMLAAVAFRFIVSLMLPKVSYLTLMDYYLLLGFLALILLIAENAIAGIPALEAYGAAIDLYSAIFFAGTWLIVHFICLGALLSKEFLRISWREMDKIDREEEEETEFIFADMKYVAGNDETEYGRRDWQKYKDYDVLHRADMYAKTHNIRRTGTFQKKLDHARRTKSQDQNDLGKIYEETIKAEDKKTVDAAAGEDENIAIYVPSKIQKNKQNMSTAIELSKEKTAKHGPNGLVKVYSEEAIEIKEDLDVQSETAEIVYSSPTVSPKNAEYVAVEKALDANDEEQLISDTDDNQGTVVSDEEDKAVNNDEDETNANNVEDPNGNDKEYVQVNTDADGFSD
eukprot:166364_1